MIERLKYNRIYITALTIYVVGIFILSRWNLPIKLDTLTDFSQITIAYFATFAVAQYWISRKSVEDEKTKTVLIFVKFFRETVIASMAGIHKQIRANPQLKIPRIKIQKNKPDLQFTQEKFINDISQHQLSLLRDYNTILGINTEFDVAVTNVLNSIEEFAIGIVCTGSTNHEATESIRKPFVEIVEYLAIPIYYHIGFFNNDFHYISELFDDWKKKIGFVPHDVQDYKSFFNEKMKIYRKQ
jgi:hypothetical protein